MNSRRCSLDGCSFEADGNETTVLRCVSLQHHGAIPWYWCCLINGQRCGETGPREDLSRDNCIPHQTGQIYCIFCIENVKSVSLSGKLILFS